MNGEMMESSIWFPCYPEKLVANTTKICPHDFGAYVRLLCEYYQTGPLKDDDDELRLITGVEKEDWKKTKPKLMSFFQMNEDGRWHQKKADLVIAYRDELISKKRAQTAAARAANPKNRVTPSDTPSVTDAQHSVTDDVTDVQVQVQVQSQVQSKEKVQSQEQIMDLPEKLNTERMKKKWECWKSARRAMRKPKSWVLLFNEQIEWLSKFEEPIALEILSASIRNGWQGLFEPNHNGAQNRNTGRNPQENPRNVGVYPGTTDYAAAVRKQEQARMAKQMAENRGQPPATG